MASAHDAGTTSDAAPDAVDETPAPLDHGMPSTTYPAFKPDMPTVESSGGSVLSAPVIVTVTWQTDALADQLEAFGDAIGGSDYWRAIGTEYGVGPATSGTANHVRIPVTAGSPVPTTITPAEIVTLLQANVGSSTSGWPAPTPQTLYVIYLHPNTELVWQFQTCPSGVDGYHNYAQVNGTVVTYAVIADCGSFDEMTSTSSHELGEATTDPHLDAFTNVDRNHVSFGLFQQRAANTEIGDMCEYLTYYGSNSFKPVPQLPYNVQRLWSNASAAAGHTPCVPARPGPYFSVTPTALEAVTADLSPAGLGLVQTKGIRIKVGETKTFPVGFYSDGPTTGPWTIVAAEAFTPGTMPSTHNLTVSIDKTTGENGEIAYVSVTVNTKGMTLSGVDFASVNFVTIASAQGALTAYMPILIVN